jgi:alginate O-acetyltransferase complex protein AlgI
MLFNSHVFLFVFLPLALAGYYVSAHLLGPQACKLWLCGASLVFYSWWHPLFVLLLMASIGFSYGISRLLTGDEDRERTETLVLTVGIVLHLSLLFYYKYLFPLLGFLHEIGWVAHDEGSVLLPIGISFFTFTQIGYLLDCRQGQISDRSFINYFLFVTFFPHLIAGPILHHREIMPQFARAETYRFRSDHMAIGLTVFSLGLAKKVLLADSIAPWVDDGFDHLQQMQLWQAWSVALGYSMQLYFDFSGYSDMAIGLGILFAIRLPLNFNSPYQARSIIDFWQRWHMTLTRYLTLLLYNPLAFWVARRRLRAGLPLGRQAAVSARGFLSLIAFPTFTTVLIAGIWHGAGLTYLVYGALHGCYLTVNHVWRTFRGVPAESTPAGGMGAWATLWRVSLTYSAVLLAQTVFRAPSLRDAAQLLSDMLGFRGIGRLAASTAAHSGFVLGLAVLAFAAPNIYRFLGKQSPALTAVAPLPWSAFHWRPTWQTATLIGALLGAAIVLCERETAFLYFQF